MYIYLHIYIYIYTYLYIYIQLHSCIYITWSSVIPALFSASSMAGTGPIPIRVGSTPTLAQATTSQSGVRPAGTDQRHLGGGGPALKAATRVAASTPPPKHLDIFKGAPLRVNPINPACTRVNPSAGIAGGGGNTRTIDSHDKAL